MPRCPLQNFPSLLTVYIAATMLFYYFYRQSQSSNFGLIFTESCFWIQAKSKSIQIFLRFMIQQVECPFAKLQLKNSSDYFQTFCYTIALHLSNFSILTCNILMFHQCNLCSSSLQMYQERPFVCPHSANELFSQNLQSYDQTQNAEVQQRDLNLAEGNTFLSDFLRPGQIDQGNRGIQFRDHELDDLFDLNVRQMDSLWNNPPAVSQEAVDFLRQMLSNQERNLRDSEGAVRQEKQSSLAQKSGKNQYDKNIPGNVVLTVLGQMVRSKHSKEIQFYCKMLEISFQKVIDFVRKSQNARKRIGTSWIGDCFSQKNAQNKIYKVFGLFMVRFLREEYYSHILKYGKMRNKSKYLECAINLMYVPRLQKCEYELISRFQ